MVTLRFVYDYDYVRQTMHRSTQFLSLYPPFLHKLFVCLFVCLHVLFVYLFVCVFVWQMR